MSSQPAQKRDAQARTADASTWWSPPSPGGMGDEERLGVAASLKGVEKAASLARTGSHEWAESGRAVWAMRQLQALRGAEEELRKVRVHLCATARDAGLPLREVAEVAGVTHPTVSKWTRSPGSGRKDEPPHDEGFLPWLLSDDELRQVASEAGVGGNALASMLSEGEAG